MVLYFKLCRTSEEVFKLSNFIVTKKIIFVLILITISLSVLAVLGEIYVRLYSGQEYTTPEIIKNRSLQYKPSLFSRHVFPQKEMIAEEWNGAKYYINKKGYRGRDFTIVKPKGIIRIIFYGGSAVFDQESSQQRDWPHRVENILRRNEFPEVEIINAGIPGHASFDSLGRFFAEGHHFNPDYIVLYNAWNDIKYFRSDKFLLRKFKPYIKSSDPRVDYQGVFDCFLCEHSQLYVLLRTRYCNWKLRLGPEGKKPLGKDVSELDDSALKQYKLNIEMFVDVARNVGTIPILMTQARLVARDNTESQKKRIRYDYQKLDHETLCEAFEKTDEIIQQVAKEKNVFLIDVSKYLTGHGKLFRDHIHSTDKGSEEIAKIVAQHIAGLLKERQ